MLVIRAPSLTMNPTLDRKLIDAEIERDPAVGRAEWLAEWREDLASYIDRTLIEAAVDAGIVARPRIPNTTYHAFCDPSGGSSDSMALAVAHREGDTVILDCLVEKPAPFNADRRDSKNIARVRPDGVPWRPLRGAMGRSELCGTRDHLHT